MVDQEINRQTVIVLCDLYDPKLYGAAQENLSGSFLCLQTASLEEFTADSFVHDLTILVESWKKKYDELHISEHGEDEGIRRYRRKFPLPRLHIAEVFTQSSGHATCVIKTPALSVFQRMWKTYYRNFISKRSSPRELLQRSVRGRWSKTTSLIRKS